jgi:hypothetical protein
MDAAITPSVLTLERLAELREAATREAGAFVDARLLGLVEPAFRAPGEWLATVLGRTDRLGSREVTWPEAVLVLRASEVDA